MSRIISLTAGFVLSLTCLAIMMVLISPEAQAAQPLDNLAIIVVSENTESSELGKAQAFYDHLLDDGYNSTNICFLTPRSVDGSDGTSNLSNIEDAFDVLVDDDEEDKDIVIYISDHCGGIINGAFFQFSDEKLNVSTIEGWMDDMVFDDLTFIIGGNRSGLAGPELQGTDRLIISSMGENDIKDPDLFNITRGLECMWADFNNDGDVSFYEAFLLEKWLLRWEDQIPQAWS